MPTRRGKQSNDAYEMYLMHETPKIQWPHWYRSTTPSAEAANCTIGADHLCDGVHSWCDIASSLRSFRIYHHMMHAAAALLLVC
jgi:hypothetical protein